MQIKKKLLTIKNQLKSLFWGLKTQLLAVFVLFSPLFCAQATLLDWSGSYQTELNFGQKGDFEEWGTARFFHNLHLQPDIKAFDNVRVRAWFLLSAPSSPLSASSPKKAPPLSSAPSDQALKTTHRLFALQEGPSFGLEGLSQTSLSAKALYMEIAHDFGFFNLGWKPHHFGMGLYYNDSSALFSPVYNLRGSRGFVSWRGFIGSSYYVSPVIHYIGEKAIDLFIQGGYTKKNYGVELIYKTKSLGVETSSHAHLNTPSYLGGYGYYKTNTFSAKLEGGKINSVYGGALDLNWQTPASWLALNLQSGLSTSENKKSFYFDPSFSSKLSFLIEHYEINKENSPEYLKQHLSYSFHSAFHLTPSVEFTFSDSWSLKNMFSTHISYSDFSVLFYHTELSLQYQKEEGFVWNLSIGALFPQDDQWRLGVLSQVAITF